MLSIVYILFTYNAFAVDTYCFRVDMASFTQKNLDQFLVKGKVKDTDIFKQTYLLPQSSYYFTLKITPQDDIELNQLLAFVGQGFDILAVYNLSGGILQVKEEHSKDLPTMKSTPATGVKP